MEEFTVDLVLPLAPPLGDEGLSALADRLYADTRPLIGPVVGLEERGFLAVRCQIEAVSHHAALAGVLLRVGRELQDLGYDLESERYDARVLNASIDVDLSPA